MALFVTTGQFLGSWHPLIVHLPIGFIMAALLIEIAKFYRPGLSLLNAKKMLWTVSALSAATAVICGLLLANTGHYIGTELSLHKWTGIALAVITLVPAAYYLGIEGLNGWPLKSAMWMAGVLLLITGHFGGQTTHGDTPLYGHLTLSGKVSSGSAHPVADLELVDTIWLYEDLLNPIFVKKCMTCHNGENKRGNYDMSTYESLTDDTFGDIIVKGDPWRSKLVKRVMLSPTNEKHMPPDGIPLFYHEKRLLEWWITEGANPEMNIRTLEPSPNMQVLLKVYYNIDYKQKSMYEKIKVDPLPEATITAIKSANFNVSTLAADNYLLDVSRSGQPREITREEMESLALAASHITWLDLSNTTLNDELMQVIGQMKNLTRLKVPNTGITEDGLAHLGELPHLSWLNIYGTDVGSTSIASLSSLKSLKKIYVWQTRLTTEDIYQLQSTNPGLEVISGIN